MPVTAEATAGEKLHAVWQRKAIAFLQENPAVSVAVAVSGGLVISEVGSFLYASAFWSVMDASG